MFKKIFFIILLLGFIAGVVIFYPSQPKEKNKLDKKNEINYSPPEEENQNSLNKWEWLSKQPKLYKLEKEEVNSLLSELVHYFPDKEDRIKALTRLELGTPYQLGCLGEEKEPDSDPLLRWDVTDCTAFVLVTTALANSQNIEEARHKIKSIGYRSDKISYKNRLHFTSDRIKTSPYFNFITKAIAGENKIKERKIILNKIKGTDTRIIDIDWEKEILIKYIPNKYINNRLLDLTPDVCGIAFLREERFKEGLDVVHEGILIDNKELVHASSKQQKVVQVNFLNYYNNLNYDGIILYNIK